jgi:hypothetical protein
MTSDAQLALLQMKCLVAELPENEQTVVNAIFQKHLDIYKNNGQQGELAGVLFTLHVAVHQEKKS